MSKDRKFGSGTSTGPVLSQDLRASIEMWCLQDCIQCGVCSCVCPVIGQMDIQPRLVIMKLLSGVEEEVLRSRSIFVCTICHLCRERCPMGIPFSDVVYELRQVALRGRVSGLGARIGNLQRVSRRMIFRKGRITEAGLVYRLGIRSSFSGMLQHLKTGWKLRRSGRLPLYCGRIREVKDVRKLINSVEGKVNKG